jgi:hypothetical protein
MLDAEAAQAPGRLQPVQAWHADVHQDHVGAAATGDLDPRRARPPRVLAMGAVNSFSRRAPVPSGP